MFCLLAALGPVLASALAAPRVVFTDCDGTMLTPMHTLSERTRRTLDALDTLGVRVVPATGRARCGAWTADVLSHPALRGGVPGIYLNGCSVYADAEPLPTPTLSAAAVESALSFAETHGLCVVAYATGAELSIEALHGTPRANSAAAALIDRLRAVGDAPLRELPALSPSQLRASHASGSQASGSQASAGSSAVVKLLLLGDRWSDREGSAALRDELSRRLGSAAALTQALPWCLEVVPPRVNKAVAVATLLERWKVPRSQVLAIGDGENDVEMLELAGVSVAMANGAESARDAAQYVVPSNSEDGWSVAMERFIISQYN